MPHETSLIATIVAGIGLAFVLGAVAQRLRIPPLVGYLLAGVVVGPFTPGYVADLSLAPQLAEIGVILLMFGVGLHFSLDDLLKVRAIAIPGAIVQMAAATAMGFGLAHVLGWPAGAGLVFGLALSVASTVVLLRALQERREVQTDKGKIAVGWLIVEDLAMVLALVLLPTLAGLLGGKTVADTADPLLPYFGGGILGIILLTFAKVIAFVVLMLVVGRRVIPWILHWVAQTGSHELFRLAVLALALGVAFGAAKLFGVSFALGAFFAGMILGESDLSHKAANETLPLRDAFAVLFFVSVGMLFDPQSIVRDALPLLATLFVILIGKSVVAFILVRLFRHPISTALTISASLAQIGEFSFILAELGIGLDLLPERGRDLILAGAIISILANPVLFWLADRLRPRFDPATANPPTQPSTSLQGHTVLVGYGRVGHLVGAALRSSDASFVVVEDDADRLAQLATNGIPAVAGNAVLPAVAAAAQVATARRLVLAIPNCFEAGQVIASARALNPTIEVLARAHSDAEIAHLSELGANTVIMGEQELARGMIAHLALPIAPAT